MGAAHNFNSKWKIIAFDVLQDKVLFTLGPAMLILGHYAGQLCNDVLEICLFRLGHYRAQDRD